MIAVLFMLLAIIVSFTIADCESDASYYARRQRVRRAAFRRELRRMRGRS